MGPVPVQSSSVALRITMSSIVIRPQDRSTGRSCVAPKETVIGAARISDDHGSDVVLPEARGQQ
jgi:hypothetical protein